MENAIAIDILPLPHYAGLPLPAYATAQSAGLDLLAAITDDVTIMPQQRAQIPTGIAIALPAGYEAQVRPRSGLAIKQGISIVNAPGTIDADYRGEIAVCLINLGTQPFTVTRGMRIAQMVIAAYTQAQWQVQTSLAPTERGSGGFGHTGL